MLHASIHGIDSHGVRLLPHIRPRFAAAGWLGGQVAFARIKPGTGMLDADHAYGARAMYEAVERAAELAGETGIAAVAVSNTYFGAAGAYALELAGRGLGGMVFGN